MAETEMLTRGQLDQVMKFANALYIAEHMGPYSPWLSNAVMQNLNNTAKVPTYEDLKKALATYKESASNLQDYSQFMTHWDMVFNRTVSSYVNTLSFDMIMTCTNAYTREDYQSEQYKKDKQKVYAFLDTFDWKRSFRDVLYQCFLNGAFFVSFRKTKWGTNGVKAAIQILPQDYCMITGAWDKGILFDFDMNFFLQAGVDIDSYDPTFKKIYSRMFGDNARDFINYRPSNALNKRDGEYAYWAQLSPEDGFWGFLWDTSNYNVTPYLSPYLKDALINEEVAELQRNKDIVGAYGILAGEIKMFESEKAQESDHFVIDPESLGGFMAQVKKGIGQYIKAVAMPVENIKFFQFNDANPDMYENQLATSAGVGSGISRVIYSSDRMSNAEVEAGIIDQYNTMRPMYYQFNNFLNFYINKLNTKYKFRFTLDGCSYPFEREKRFDKLSKLADKGLVLGPSAWAAASGYEIQTFDRLLEEAKYSDFADKFMMMMNRNTNTFGGTSSSENGPGRPQSDDSDLSESGEYNRNSEGEL